MSNFIAIDRRTKKRVTVLASDNHFGAHKYGYIPMVNDSFAGQKTLTEEEFEDRYVREVV